MFIVVGLGNKDACYNNTYHNLGFMVVDKLANRLGVSFSGPKQKSMIAGGCFIKEKI